MLIGSVGEGSWDVISWLGFFCMCRGYRFRRGFHASSLFTLWEVLEQNNMSWCALRLLGTSLCEFYICHLILSLSPRLLSQGRPELVPKMSEMGREMGWQS